MKATVCIENNYVLFAPEEYSILNTHRFIKQFIGIQGTVKSSPICMYTFLCGN